MKSVKSLADLSEYKLYEITVCEGEKRGCPCLVDSASTLKEDIEKIMIDSDFTNKRKSSLKGPVLPHHRFKIAVSTCPNACSQPQIKDIGIILQAVVSRGNGICSNCRHCVNRCLEGAIKINKGYTGKWEPEISTSLCLDCGICAKVCPTKSIIINKIGFKLLAGGKLGRKPRLGRDINSFCTRQELLSHITCLIDNYLEIAQGSEKMADIL